MRNTSSMHKQKLQKTLYARYRLDPLPNPQSADTKAQKILRVQRPEAVTVFKVGDTTSNELLPGGIPVIDHLIAFLEPQPGWKKTNDVLKSFSKARITSPDALPEIVELQVGISTPTQFKEVGDWIDIMHRENEEQYGFCMPAVDVEHLGLILEGSSDNWRQIKDEFMLSERLRAMVHSSKLKTPKRFSFPVLLMYGGIGWQVHLRIPVTYHPDGPDLHVEIEEQYIESDVLVKFLSHLRPAVGVGIKKDVEEFIKAVNAVCNTKLETKHIPVGIPLDELAKLAGISHPQTSLVFFTYLVLGGVLPKEWRCSVADHKWGKPIAELGVGLKAYLAGDIQQVSRVAATLAIAWIVHITPDASYITSEIGLEPLQFIADAIDFVTTFELNLLGTTQRSAVTATTREDLLVGMGLTPNEQSTLVSSCPPWPAITSGGPKTLESTREFSKGRLSTIKFHLDFKELDKFDELYNIGKFVSAVVATPLPEFPLLNTPVVSPVKMLSPRSNQATTSPRVSSANPPPTAEPLSFLCPHPLPRRSRRRQPSWPRDYRKTRMWLRAQQAWRDCHLDRRTV